MVTQLNRCHSEIFKLFLVPNMGTPCLQHYNNREYLRNWIKEREGPETQQAYPFQPLPFILPKPPSSLKLVLLPLNSR